MVFSRANSQAKFLSIKFLGTSSAKKLVGIFVSLKLAKYLEKLNDEIELLKTDSIKLLDDKDIPGNLKMMVDSLPASLKQATIKKFILSKLSELKQLVNNIYDDEVLHSIRKILKDILYNWPVIKPYHNLLPPGISKKKNIRSFVAKISEDLC